MNTYTGLTAEQNTYYQRTLLDELMNNVVLMPYGKKTPIPKNAGDSCHWRRFNLPALTKTAITEGVTPSDINVTIEKVTATTAQYGTFTKVSDKLDLVGIDPVVSEITKLFGKHAGLTMDSIAMDIVAAGTNVYYPGTRTARNQVALGDIISEELITRILETMKINNVPKIKMPDGKMGFLALAHPKVMSNILGSTWWKDANKYENSDLIRAGIVGQYFGIYFMDCNIAPVYTGAGAAGVDVYGTVVLGMDGFGIPDVAGSSKPQIIVKPKESGGTENPMELYSTIAWKSMFTAKILEPKAVLRIETAIK